MNGRRYFLDTNAIVQVLAGNSGCTLITADRQLLNMKELDVKGYAL